MSTDYGSWALEYDTLVSPRPAEVAFYVARARAQGGPVLEIGCGTGRLTIPLAETGLAIWGLDISPLMLQVLRTKLTRRPELAVRLSEGDMRAFDLGETFALILVPYYTFNHMLTPEDQLAALRAIRRHLRPDGRLILALLPYAYHELALQQWESILPARFLPDGRALTCRGSFCNERRNQCVHLEWNYELLSVDGVSRGTIRFHYRYLFPPETEFLLRLTGFQADAVYGDFDGRPYDYPPREVIFVARPE